MNHQSEMLGQYCGCPSMTLVRSPEFTRHGVQGGQATLERRPVEFGFQASHGNLQGHLGHANFRWNLSPYVTIKKKIHEPFRTAQNFTRRESFSCQTYQICNIERHMVVSSQFPLNQFILGHGRLSQWLYGSKKQHVQHLKPSMFVMCETNWSVDSYPTRWTNTLQYTARKELSKSFRCPGGSPHSQVQCWLTPKPFIDSTLVGFRPFQTYLCKSIGQWT